MEIISMIILGLSGLLLVFVGVSRLTNPIKTYLNSSGIHLPNEVNLLNEMRGVGAVMLCGGIICLVGIVLPEFTTSSFIVGSLIFLGFALGRFVSVAGDGSPNKKIKQGIVFELVLGGANLFALIVTIY